MSASLLLASASPRRQRLLGEAGIAFEVRPATVEEQSPARGDPHVIAVANATLKAEAIARTARDRVVLGADTVVALPVAGSWELLGKPRDKTEARAMLARLSGRCHVVVTGLALMAGGRRLTRSVATGVEMRPLTDAELDAYAASGEGMGKAGGYAIQESADRFVERLDGPFDNVVGLPVETVREMLAEIARAT